ncbi:hypothetical protein B2G71_13495 [Novosphingobium sp. PC22D]|uniref:acyl-CoA thioesterase n=1 Tax=Novosphingobium sp. PC22D TaxID=1962403 RepID=UPI000BF19CF8|nr:thioesterase family protein [Novosphingobium sp. PC22D]PEQ12152.1 hypothetical protein B2G71_13495 [Novosphingobium sp. PC22D]
MARPDPALLDPARYPYHTTIEPRFGDLDVNLHINNAAMAQIIEHGRVKFHHATETTLRDGTRTSMVASLHIEYLGEAGLDELDMHIGVAAVGRTSRTLAQLVTQNGKPMAFARATLVNIVGGRPAPLSPELTTSCDTWKLEP